MNKWAWLIYVINENIELTLKKVSLYSDAAGKLNWSPTRDIFFLSKREFSSQQFKNICFTHLSPLNPDL